MVARTFRVYFSQPFRGRRRQNLQIPGVNITSVAVITAAEYKPEGVPSNHSNERLHHLGDANIWVSNVGVHGDDGTPNNGVEFIINVDFPQPLFVFVDITILDTPVSVMHL